MKRILLSFLVMISTLLSAQTWQWARSENVYGEGNAICTDPQGNIFLTGHTYSVGSISTNTIGEGYGYVTKYSATGLVAWTRSFVFTSNNKGSSYGVTADPLGNVYVTGTFSGTLMVGSNTFTTYNVPNQAFLYDMFLIKYDAAGNLVWAKTFGNSQGNEAGYSACTDGSGNIVICGSYSSQNFALGTVTLTSPYSTSKFFLAKFNGNGVAIWASGSQGTGVATAYNVDMDHFGNFYICGNYGFNMVAGTTTLTSSGYSDFNWFIAKYDGSGVFQWIRGGGGTQNDHAFAVDADPTGGAYVTGGFNPPSLVAGTTTLTSAGSHDAFIIRYDASGNQLWAKNIGSVGSENGEVVRAHGNGFFLAGHVAPFGTCTLVIGTASIVPKSVRTTWIAEFDGSGNPTGFVDYNYGTSGPGMSFNPLCMLIDKSCNMYLGGDVTYQAVLGTTTINSVGNHSPFMAKLSLPATAPITVSVTGNLPVCTGKSATLTAAGALNYNWTNGPPTNTFVVTPAMTSTFSVAGTSACSTSTAVVTVTVVPTPTLVISSNQPTYCAGSPAQISASGAATYSWSTGAQTPSITLVTSIPTKVTVIGTNHPGNCTSSKTMTLNVLNCMDIAEPWQETILAVYPNPAAGRLTVELNSDAPHYLSLHDATGRLVRAASGVGTSAVVDLLALPAGIYILVAANEHGRSCHKVIKE